MYDRRGSSKLNRKSMGIHPILSAMRRNKFGAILIIIQMAVTLAFLANALTLVEQRLAWSRTPTFIMGRTKLFRNARRRMNKTRP